MDLFYRCICCNGPDVWRVKVHGTRPYARTLIGDVECPSCRNLMDETGPIERNHVKDLRGKW